MTGTSVRLLGIRGALGLLALAVLLLPVGASWAQKAEEPAPLLVAVDAADGQAAPEIPAELTKDGPRIFTDVTATLPTNDADIVNLTVQVQDRAGSRVLATGRVDDIVKKLQKEIAELKTQATGPADSLKERIGILERALKEVQKIPGVVTKIEVEPGFKGVSVANIRLIEELGPNLKDDEKAPAIAKLRQRVSELRSSMERNAKDVHEAQAKIRELGGDPGDVPVLEWRRTPKSSQQQKTQAYRAYVKALTHAKITRPVKKEVAVPIEFAKPHTEEGSVTYTITRPDVGFPIEFAKPHTEAKSHANERGSAKVLDPATLQILERKLKALQDEVERLKRGSTQPGTAK